MKPTRFHSQPYAASRMHGISLIETMVGLTLGLVVVLVITQVWGNFEAQRSRTSSSATAQENGLIALTQIEQSVRNAGAGMNADIFSCSQIFSTYDSGSGSVYPAPGIPTTTPAPITITSGGTTGSDTIQIIRATDLNGSIKATVSVQDPQQNAVINLDNVNGFSEVPSPCSAADKQQHLAVCQHGTQCIVFQVTNILEAALKLNANKGTCAPYNPVANCYHSGQPCAAWPTIDVGDHCFAIGSFSTVTYSINASNQLQAVTSAPGVSTTDILVDNIVSFQAQYGVASGAGVQEVSSWVEPTGTWASGSLTPALINRIKAIRLVIVARSIKPEASNVTGTCINNAGTNNGPCAWVDTSSNPAPKIDLSSNANWQKYRYRTYQTIIPLRNVIWANV